MGSTHRGIQSKKFQKGFQEGGTFVLMSEGCVIEKEGGGAVRGGGGQCFVIGHFRRSVLEFL